MIVDIISILSGVISIVLAIYAINFAKEESRKSQENYTNTKELMKEVDHKVSLIDRGIEFEQQFLMQIINKLLNKEGQAPIAFQPISLREIDELIEGKTLAAQKRIEELQDIIEKAPRIFVQEEEPVDSKEGDIWLQTKGS